MTTDPNAKLHRKSNRLPGYDYSSSGAYFITLVTYDRECLFGEVLGTTMQLNQFGSLVEEEWKKSALIRSEIALDNFVVMPNHFHAVVWFRRNDNVGAQGLAPLRTGSDSALIRPAKSLGTLVTGFKSAVTQQVNRTRNSPGEPVWQRNYYDRIVRDEEELIRIRRYIAENPAIWHEDPENPASSAQSDFATHRAM